MGNVLARRTPLASEHVPEPTAMPPNRPRSVADGDHNEQRSLLGTPSSPAPGPSSRTASPTKASAATTSTSDATAQPANTASLPNLKPSATKSPSTNRRLTTPLHFEGYAPSGLRPHTPLPSLILGQDTNGASRGTDR